MAPKKTVRRPRVSLTACWGHDDVDSTITISPRQWRLIQAGDEYVQGAWSWYEGRRMSVLWSFKHRHFSVFPSGDDGGEHIVECPIEELIVEER